MRLAAARSSRAVAPGSSSSISTPRCRCCLLVLAPICWFVRRNRRRRHASLRAVGRDRRPSRSRPTDAPGSWRSACAVTSLAPAPGWRRATSAASLNLRFGDLPPAYHDEFSYLLQAKTFLARPALVSQQSAAARAVRPDARRQRGTFCQPLLSRRRRVDRAVLSDRAPVLGAVAGRRAGGVLSRSGLGASWPAIASGCSPGLLTALSPGIGLVRQPALVAPADDRRPDACFCSPFCDSCGRDDDSTPFGPAAA